MDDTPARFLEGERLYLSPIEEGDARLYVRWLNSPAVRENLMIARPLTIMAEREWIAKLDERGDVIFGIRLRQDDTLIGNTGLHGVNNLDRHAEFGIVIGEAEHRGRGYGTEATGLLLAYAFDTLNLHRVWLRVFGYNVGAAEVYRRCGFVDEGVFRKAHWNNGDWHDEIIMGILAEEYCARRGQSD